MMDARAGTGRPTVKGESMNTWDDELVELVDEDAQRVAVEWAQLHELPPLGDPAAEVERVQSVAAATLALHLSRRSGGDDVIVPDELEREVLDAARRADPSVWESLRPADPWSLVPGPVVLAALGVPA